MDGAVWELGPLEGPRNEGVSGPRSGRGAFLETFKNALLEVDQDQRRADAALVSYATGETRDLHGVALALKKAELSFRFMLSVRRKAIEAYQELTRMNV